jgi:thioredoxin-like negative regulator of GroEL
LLKDISKVWLDMQRWEQARESLEMALRARANKDSSKHQKKLEEFLKAVGESTKNSDEIRSKFKELMVKQNVLKDDDWTANAFIDTLAKVKAK